MSDIKEIVHNLKSIMPNTSSLIKLDYDGKTLYTFEKRRWLLKYLGLTVVWIEKDRTVHGGWHVRIKVKERLKPEEIMAIQALLGSDYRREVYNMFRIRNGMLNWNALFKNNEPKEAYRFFRFKKEVVKK